MAINDLKSLKPLRQPDTRLLRALKNKRKELICKVTNRSGAFNILLAINEEPVNKSKLSKNPTKVETVSVRLIILPTLSLSFSKSSGMNLVVVSAIPEPTKIINTLIVDRTIPTSPYPSFPSILATINQATKSNPLEIAEPNKDQKELMDNSFKSSDLFTFPTNSLIFFKPPKFIPYKNPIPPYPLTTLKL